METLRVYRLLIKLAAAGTVAMLGEGIMMITLPPRLTGESRRLLRVKDSFFFPFVL